MARNVVAPASAALHEAYTLTRDRLLHAYWQRRPRQDSVVTKAEAISWASSSNFSLTSGPNSQALSLNSQNSRDSWRKTPAQKNVIWIMLDALRADIFATYLQRGGLRDLAPRALVFPRAFAQGSWTYPSIFSFLTGLYPFNCGVSQLARQDGGAVSLCADFDESCPTLFSILRQHGYETGSILDGWGYTVRKTAGQEHRENRYFEENWGWFYGQDRRFLTLQEQREASVDYIRQAAASGPFALFLRSLYTHSPYREIFKSSEYVTALSRRRWRFRLVEGFARGLQTFEDVYMRAIMTTLKEIEQLDNTIIILCSDHGDMFWDVEDDLRRGGVSDEEMWRHQLEPYNGLIKVPLLLWGARRSGIYPHRFRLMDVLPTLLDELSITYEPAAFDGVSIYNEGSRPLYADSAGYGNGGVAFQDAGAKLLMSRRLGLAAYDISPDGYERLASRRDGSNELPTMLDFVIAANRRPDTFMAPGAESGSARTLPGDHDDALQRRLKALGYL